MRASRALSIGSALSAVFCSAVAFAAPDLGTPTYSDSVTSDTAFDSQITAGKTSANLVYRVANPNFSSVSSSSAPSFGYSTDNLNDGSGSITPYLAGALPTTVTFNLNLTNSALGYSITSLDSFAGYASQGQTAAQSFELYFTFVGSSTPVDYGTYTNTNNTALTALGTASGSSLTTINPLVPGTAIATGVSSIELTYTAPNSTGTFLREIQAFGTATVAGSSPSTPEPASLSMLALAAGAAVLRRRTAGR